jgi:hypothetical protein
LALYKQYAVNFQKKLLVVPNSLSIILLPQMKNGDIFSLFLMHTKMQKKVAESVKIYHQLPVHLSNEKKRVQAHSRPTTDKTGLSGLNK